ncbi:hypothetical protein GLOTRDRAFT_90922 [Gloeophyllum trabeum ATCC 11539]|uniref:Uncharacterized protein n=1 Tax=Gloeophyllum trabeum (strain ATCC 11539 / FP-39264 / Madison 617) TaxID=670483 RepID=S7QIV8_GLOTA|nr:uncharacterized protein GLOTRDRAFT_90922 [Gloeophyllum trabeum ATCC 11539]EPQ59282.1 hypothetical protein GLOTRDRAFT_90922 [Gloeophyllum trabeum ATCC 11539]
MTPQNKPHSPCTRGREETEIPNLRPKAEIACDACRRAHAKVRTLRTARICPLIVHSARKLPRLVALGVTRPAGLAYTLHMRGNAELNPLLPAPQGHPQTQASYVDRKSRGESRPALSYQLPFTPLAKCSDRSTPSLGIDTDFTKTHPRPQDGRHHQPTAGHASTSSYTTRPPWEHTNHLATGIPRATNASAGDSVANYAHSGTTLNSATAAVPLFPDLNWTIDPQTFAVHNNVLSGHQYAPFPPCNEDGHAWY